MTKSSVLVGSSCIERTILCDTYFSESSCPSLSVKMRFDMLGNTAHIAQTLASLNNPTHLITALSNNDDEGTDCFYELVKDKSKLTVHAYNSDEVRVPIVNTLVDMHGRTVARFIDKPNCSLCSDKQIRLTNINKLKHLIDNDPDIMCIAIAAEHGMLTNDPSKTKKIIKYINEKEIPLIIFGEIFNYQDYVGADYIVANPVALDIATDSTDPIEAMDSAFDALYPDTSAIIVPTNGRGLFVGWIDDTIYKFHTFLPPSNIGAGDYSGVFNTVVALLAHNIADTSSKEMNLLDVLRKINIGCNLIATRTGQSVLTEQAYQAALAAEMVIPKVKEIDVETVGRQVECIKHIGGKIGIVFGGFRDIDYRAVRAIQEAKKENDFLIIALYKQEDANNYAEKAELLCALEMVDALVQWKTTDLDVVLSFTKVIEPNNIYFDELYKSQSWLSDLKEVKDFTVKFISNIY